MSSEIEKQVASLLKKTNDGVQSTPKVVQNLVHEYQVLSIWETVLCFIGVIVCVLALWWIARQYKADKSWVSDSFIDTLYTAGFLAVIGVILLLIVLIICLFFTIPASIAPDISLLNNIFGGY